MIMPSLSDEGVDLSQTPLAEFAELIDLYAEQHEFDPLVLAALIMLESSGDPNAYNETSKATGLGQVMPYEAGPLFVDRPTIQELKDPETNIKWACIIFASKLRPTYSLRDALFHYSGGAYWLTKYGSEEGYAKFNELYWSRFKYYTWRLANAGIRHQTSYFAGYTVGTSTTHTE